MRGKKHRVISLFLLVFLLAGCAKMPDMSRVLIPYDASYPMDQASWENYLSTDSVIYHRAKNLLRFCPEGDTAFYPLCGKPNCAHTNADCNAWLHGGSGLGYHKGRLYAVTAAEEGDCCGALVSLDPTGENRRDELAIPSIHYSDGTSGCAAYFRFHEDKLICFLEASAEEPYEEQINKILIVDLDTMKTAEPFTPLLSRHARVGFDAQIAGDHIYARTELPMQDGSTELWMMELDMDSGKTAQLERAEQTSTWYAENNRLYAFKASDGFEEYDLQTGKSQNCGLPVAELQAAVWSGDLICGIGTRSEDLQETTIYFFNREYELLDQIHLTDGIMPCYYGKDLILLRSRNDPTIGRPTHWLDRSAIGSGKLELRPIG